MAEVTLFAGPSVRGVAEARVKHESIDLKPPVRRGDIPRLLKHKAPGVMILCDGVFQAAPAVSHAEICAALDAGWQVWGVSSIGAIRAFEMRGVGVRGFGWVYEQFARYEDFADDELSLLQLPEAPYLALSEPLVNLRFALERRGAALGIGAGAARELIAALRRLWFGDRTVPRMHQLLLTVAGADPAAATELLAWMTSHPVKSIDLARLLRLRPWQLPPVKRTSAPVAKPQKVFDMASTSATGKSAPKRISSMRRTAPRA